MPALAPDMECIAPESLMPETPMLIMLFAILPARGRSTMNQLPPLYVMRTP